MAMRGDRLREHILYTAKNVFQELGFERTSMEVVALRAETSKRTLYAHFENKEALYLAVIDLVRGLLLHRLKTPGDYSEDAAEAVTLFCGQFLEVLLYDATIRMCRMSMAEAERFPEGAARYFDVLFSIPHAHLTTYFAETFGLTEAAAADAASELLGRLIYPRFPRALFGLETLSAHLSEGVTRPDFDLAPVHMAVEEILKSLPILSANKEYASAKSSLDGATLEGPHAVTDPQWQRILPLLPPQRPQTGRPALDHRQIVNGILWALGTGRPWRDLPARYGRWRTVYSRFRRWQAASVWQAVQAELLREAEADRKGKLSSD